MSDAGQVTEITLQFDWRVDPLWVSVDNDVPENCSTGDIAEYVSFSAELLADIAEWNDRMQNTYRDDAPQDSGLRDEAEQKFIADGRELARRLKQEVGPGIRVEYVPLGGSTEVVES
jgi:hypothetical protein